MTAPAAQTPTPSAFTNKRVNFSDGNREAHLCAFYEWLPKDLHDAPGIAWTRLSSRILGYCVHTIGENPDKGSVALAIGTAISALGQASLHQYLSRFYHLLCTIRKVCGIQHLSELSSKDVWEEFAQKTEATLTRYHELRAYVALVEKHVRFYVEHLARQDRERFSSYLLPPPPPVSWNSMGLSTCLLGKANNAEKNGVIFLSLSTTCW